MSGGDPPLPPSRPPYQSWQGRPSHRRRGGAPGAARNGWVGRRPRSPAPPSSFRPRHPRPAPYKHHRHLPQTPPPASQGQLSSGGYHPHGPPPPLSRNLQSRLRSPPRSPPRRPPDIPVHRGDQPPYRGEPGPSHRVELGEHPLFRGPGPDHPPLRGPPLKPRGEPPPFRSEHASHRGPPEHPPYRGEPGPLYRADMPSLRDDYEPRRAGGDGIPHRGEMASPYGSWFRQPGKIHKTIKPKKRRLPPHMINALRSSGTYMSKPESPILSRVGLPPGDRGIPRPRTGTPPMSLPSAGRQVSDNASEGTTKVSAELKSGMGSRGTSHGSPITGASHPRRPGPSPRRPQEARNPLRPPDRIGLEKSREHANGPSRGDSVSPRLHLMNGEKHLDRPARERGERLKQEEGRPKPLVLCNGSEASHLNGPAEQERKVSTSRETNGKERETSETSSLDKRKDGPGIPGLRTMASTPKRENLQSERKEPSTWEKMPPSSHAECEAIARGCVAVSTSRSMNAKRENIILGVSADREVDQKGTALEAAERPSIRTHTPAEEKKPAVAKSIGNTEAQSVSQQKPEPRPSSPHEIRLPEKQSPVSKTFSEPQRRIRQDAKAHPEAAVGTENDPVLLAKSKGHPRPLERSKLRKTEPQELAKEQRSAQAFERTELEKLEKIPARPRLRIPLSSKSLVENASPSPRTPLSLHSTARSKPVVAPTSPTLFRSAAASGSGPSPSHSQTITKDASIARSQTEFPATSEPALVPTTALSRSSPHPRNRSSSLDAKLGSLNAFAKLTPSPPPQIVASPKSLGKLQVASTELVNQIHDIESKISATERELSERRAARTEKHRVTAPERQVSKPDSSNADLRTDNCAALASEIAARDDKTGPPIPPMRSSHPLHAESRRLLSVNRSKAAAAHAVFRTLCSDTERGLEGIHVSPEIRLLDVSDELRSRIANELQRQRLADMDRRKALRREYLSLLESWQRRLKSARDKRSKEKREAIRERDRFLLLCTKGTSALLTSRTSSGRTSTKLVPSVGANGQMNGTAELDALLADIESEGGTPGSKLIWSKTLADNPVQEPSRRPRDCHAVRMDDPIAEHHAARAVNPWRYEEVVVFLDKYLAYSKNFWKIASFFEHKSPRDCSYFYYANKLGLGLKQLTKEASALKRKGALRVHLEELAKRHTFQGMGEPSNDSHVVAVRNAIASNAGDRFALSGDAVSGQMAGSFRGNGSEKRDPHFFAMKRSERILSDARVLDLSGIDRKSFANAFARHGTDWRAVSSTLSVPGKTSSHYREFYRKNKRRLEPDDPRESSRARLLSSSKSGNAAVRQSPRISPRVSPRTSSHVQRGRIEEDFFDREPDVMELDEREDTNSVPKRPRRGESMSCQRATLDVASTAKYEDERSMGLASKGEGGAKKAKPTATWTAEEGTQFRILFKQYGRDWKAIAQRMSPKTPTQIKGYWRKVAHEVGDGRGTDGTQAGKAERKRARRKSADDGTSRADTAAANGDFDYSSKPPERTRRDSRDEHKGNPRDDMNHERLGREKSPQPVTQSPALLEADMRRSSPSGAGAVNGIENGEDNADSSSARHPQLRSLPIPILRSVPFPKSSNGGDSKSDSVKAEDSTAGETEGQASKPESEGNGNRHQDELRKAADYYGVRELLGSRLRDTLDREGNGEAS